MQKRIPLYIDFFFAHTGKKVEFLSKNYHITIMNFRAKIQSLKMTYLNFRA